MSKDKTTDRVFQFHGGQCGKCDKADDTTKTNTADLWKLYGSIHKAFSFSVSLTREKYKKNNSIKKITITHQNITPLILDYFMPFGLFPIS